MQADRLNIKNGRKWCFCIDNNEMKSFIKSSADDTVEVSRVFMHVDHLTHARLHSNLRVNRSLDAGNKANAAMNHARTPTSLVTNPLRHNRTVIDHASLSRVEQFDIT